MYSFSVETKEVKAPSVAEVRSILSAEMPDPMRLAVLLGLNCGFTQQDILDLTPENIDLVAGTITRKRGKVKHVANAPTVTYQLWPETLKLLKSKSRKWKNARAIDREWAKLGCHYSFKFFRKAGSSALATHPEYSRFDQLYLGHTPTTVADRHYTAIPQKLFDEAIKWLGKQFGVD